MSFFSVFLFLESLVWLQALLAYQDSFLTVYQMNQRGIALGLPFVWHGGMWGDALVISPLAAKIVNAHKHVWKCSQVLAAVVLSLAISGALHWIYVRSNASSLHAHDHSLTPAGYTHLIYMILAMAPFLLLLFWTPAASRRFLTVVAVLLLTHAFFGLNMGLGALSAVTDLPWYDSRPLRDTLGWCQIFAVAACFVWRIVTAPRAAHCERS